MRVEQCTYFLKKRYDNRGYIALLSVMFISAIGLAIMLHVITAGVDAGKMDLVYQQLGMAKSVASSCVEDALQKIGNTGTTSLSSSLTSGSSSCVYSIAPSGGTTVTISATGTMGTITSKIRVIVSSTSTPLILSSWEDVADF
jgi:hypothetical protein